MMNSHLRCLLRCSSFAIAVLYATGYGQAQTETGTKVGGLPPVTLHRTATTKGAKPEFLSVQVFPGRGMEFFQITANLPGKGEIQLMKSPTVEVAARTLTGTGPDEYGTLNHSFGGAFLIPFSSRISGDLSADKKTVTTHWQGKPIVLPNTFMGRYAVHGLVDKFRAEEIKVRKTPDGETVTAVIHAGDFGGRWLSRTDLHYTIRLQGHAVDATITATNVGSEAEPMAIGWHPYFAIPSGDRSQVRVHLPAERVSAIDKIDGRPTGEFEQVEGTPRDYRSPEGALLPPDESLSLNYSKLTRTKGVLDVWMADPKSNYGIRVLGISPEINTVHLFSPKNDTFVALEEQFNYMDALGPQWHGMDTGMVTLQPGQSTTWHVRLELFTPKQ